MLNRMPDKRDGFTLIEMMVTLAIIAFLGMTAVPLTQRLIQSAQVDNADTQLNHAIATARSLAMRNPGGFTAFRQRRGSTMRRRREQFQSPCRTRTQRDGRQCFRLASRLRRRQGIFRWNSTIGVDQSVTSTIGY